MKPEDVKVGQTYFIHPFRKTHNAGAKIRIEKRFGVDFMVRLLYCDAPVMVFYTDLWRGYDD